MLSAFSIGAVLALQGYTQLARVGAEESVGVGVALVLLRELGPVVTGLLFAGRAGSAVTAEIGLMKATDQLSSMEMMGVDPLHRIIAPRLWAGMICMPLLTLIFNAVAIGGSAIVGVDWLGVDAGGFWGGMQDGVQRWEDIGKGMMKSGVFGVVISWIAVFQGYDSTPTAEGISVATTKTVVYSSVAVLALDFILTLGHVRRLQLIRMRTIEISVGAFVLAAILCLVFLAFRVSGVGVGDTSGGSYVLNAKFDDVAGLRVRSKVSLAGVTIGRVAKIGVDSETAEAIVTMQISQDVANLPVDTGARIQTEGIPRRPLHQSDSGRRRDGAAQRRHHHEHARRARAGRPHRHIHFQDGFEVMRRQYLFCGLVVLSAIAAAAASDAANGDQSDDGHADRRHQGRQDVLRQRPAAVLCVRSKRARPDHRLRYVFARRDGRVLQTRDARAARAVRRRRSNRV